jgi:phosphatidylglycerophosphate synthase
VFAFAVFGLVVWTHLPWWLIATAMVLAIVTSILAARRPARTAARLSVVAALFGGLLATAVGLLLLAPVCITVLDAIARRANRRRPHQPPATTTTPFGRLDAVTSGGSPSATHLRRVRP